MNAGNYQKSWRSRCDVALMHPQPRWWGRVSPQQLTDLRPLDHVRIIAGPMVLGRNIWAVASITTAWYVRSQGLFLRSTNLWEKATMVMWRRGGCRVRREGTRRKQRRSLNLTFCGQVGGKTSIKCAQPQTKWPMEVAPNSWISTSKARHSVEWPQHPPATAPSLCRRGLPGAAVFVYSLS